jgi:hypothetical protein
MAKRQSSKGNWQIGMADPTHNEICHLRFAVVGTCLAPTPNSGLALDGLERKPESIRKQEGKRNVIVRSPIGRPLPVHVARTFDLAA